MLSARFVASTVGGNERQPIEGVQSWRWYTRHGQAPTLRLSWAEAVAPEPILTGPCEVALELATDGGAWIEPRDGRLISAQTDYERLADQSGTRTLQFVGLRSLLDGPTTATAGHDLSEDGKRKFLSQTPGTHIATLLQEAQARGALPHMQLGFTATKDSNNVNWPLVYTRYYDEGITLAQAVQGLWDSGAIDDWMEGWTLHASPSEARQLDVHIRDQHLESSPETEVWQRLVNKVIVLGDEGRRWEFTNPQATTPFGSREKVISAGGVVDEATARMLADQELLAGAGPARTYTREWVETEQPAMPGRDLRLGDWITVDTAAGEQRMRIADMSLRVDSPDEPMRAFITVGTVADDLLSRVAKRTRGIEGGAGVISQGRPAPANPTGAAPAAPQAVLVDPSTYVDVSGRVLGQAQVSWDAVTTSSTGLAMSIAGYRVAWRPNLTGEPYRGIVETTGTTAGLSPLPAGSEIVVRVAAQGANRQWGAWSAEVVATVPADNTPPEVPSTPVVSTGPGVVRVGWDGANTNGGGMPLDFAYLEVAVGETADPPVIGVLAGAGTLVWPATPGQTVYTRLRAVDTAGNRSGWSQTVAIIVVSVLDDVDLTAARTDGSFYVDGTIAGRAIVASSIGADHLMVGAVTAGAIAVGAVRAEHLEIGAVDRSKLAGDVSGSLDAADAWAERTVLEPGRITITGAVGSTAYMTLTATAQEWWAGGVRVAYTDATTQEMGIRSARIEQTLQVGRHVIESYNSEITLIRWVG